MRPRGNYESHGLEPNELTVNVYGRLIAAQCSNTQRLFSVTFSRTDHECKGFSRKYTFVARRLGLKGREMRGLFRLRRFFLPHQTQGCPVGIQQNALVVDQAHFQSGKPNEVFHEAVVRPGRRPR